MFCFQIRKKGVLPKIGVSLNGLITFAGDVPQVKYKLCVDIHPQNLNKRHKGSVQQFGSVRAAETTILRLVTAALLRT